MAPVYFDGRPAERATLWAAHQTRKQEERKTAHQPKRIQWQSGREHPILSNGRLCLGMSSAAFARPTGSGPTVYRGGGEIGPKGRGHHHQRAGAPPASSHFGGEGEALQSSTKDPMGLSIRVCSKRPAKPGPSLLVFRLLVPFDHQLHVGGSAGPTRLQGSANGTESKGRAHHTHQDQPLQWVPPWGEEGRCPLEKQLGSMPLPPQRPCKDGGAGPQQPPST